MQIEQKHVGKYVVDGQFFESKEHHEYVLAFNCKQLDKRLVFAFGPIMAVLLLLASCLYFSNFSVGTFNDLFFGMPVFIISWMIFSMFYPVKKYKSITPEEGWEKMNNKSSKPPPGYRGTSC